MFYNATLRARLGRRHDRIQAFLQDALARAFDRYPNLRGVIVRIGESDGLDIRSEFRSELALRSARRTRQYLRALLPVFEAHERTLIFRTWTVGAHPIGDLIWNRRTLRRTLRGLDHPRLMLSLKYGETDFFRGLPLNRHFFRVPQPKLIELQARREYEGAGEFPAFIGRDYERYRDELAARGEPAGVWIWCQTGGWMGFRRRTFLTPPSVWNEINVWVSLRLFRDGDRAPAAVAGYARRYLPDADPARLLQLLQWSEDALDDALYLEEFTRRKLFFRRLRLPPLLWVFWDRVLITAPLRALLR